MNKTPFTSIIFGWQKKSQRPISAYIYIYTTNKKIYIFLKFGRMKNTKTHEECAVFKCGTSRKTFLFKTKEQSSPQNTQVL